MSIMMRTMNRSQVFQKMLFVRKMLLMHKPFKVLALTLSPTTPLNIVVGCSWKNTIILLLGRRDISGDEALTLWVSPSFQVDGEKEIESYSGLFPRLDRWLAGELTKSLKSIPELSFRVQAFVEGCTRKGQAPRGRAILHMISRHFDLGRGRGLC